MADPNPDTRERWAGRIHVLEAERDRYEAALSQIENISEVGSAAWEIAREALGPGESDG